MSRGCHRKILEEGHPDRFAKLPLAGQESHLLRAEVAALEQGRGVKSRLSMARGESAWARRPAVNGVQVGEAATGSEEGESFGVIGSHVVVAVIAVVACNACNARIARNADGSGCVQRRNDVDDSQWSGGPESSVMGPECSSVIGSSLQAMVQ